MDKNRNGGDKMQMQSLQKIAYLAASVDGKSYDAHTIQMLAGRIERALNNRLRVRHQHPLETHYAKSEINSQQMMAGERLQKDYAIAHKNTSILERMMGGGRGVLQITPEEQKTAKDRYNRVMANLNNVSRFLVMNVVIEGQSLADIHQEMGWAQRNSGLDRLKEVLDEVDHSYERMENGENLYRRFENNSDVCFRKVLDLPVG